MVYLVNLFRITLYLIVLSLPSRCP